LTFIREKKGKEIKIGKGSRNGRTMKDEHMKEIISL
jgi:hypothetical protein